MCINLLRAVEAPGYFFREIAHEMRGNIVSFFFSLNFRHLSSLEAMKNSVYPTDNAVFTNLESAINHGDLALIDKYSALFRRKRGRKSSKTPEKLVLGENVRS